MAEHIARRTHEATANAVAHQAIAEILGQELLADSSGLASTGCDNLKTATASTSYCACWRRLSAAAAL
jgi:hypothetical protein